MVDFRAELVKNLFDWVNMKKLWKFLLLLIGIFSTFLLGFHFGKEKEKARIPKFQDDSDKTF
jgi:hypothetical protein